MELNLSTYYEYEEYFEAGSGTVPVLNPNAEPCLPKEPSPFARYFGLLFLFFVFVLGLVGNSSVLTILGRRHRSWRFADHYLFQLALADLLLVFTLPLRAAQFIHGWPFGEFLCKLAEGLSTMNFYTGILLLTYLSIERYLTVVEGAPPTVFSKLSHICLTSALFWGIGIGFAGVDFHFRTVSYVPEAQTLICQLDLVVPTSDSWKLVLQLFSFLLGFWWPTLAMVYCCIRIVTKLRRAQLLQKHLSLRLLVIIWITFIACWAPFHSLTLVDILQRLGHLPRHCRWEKALDKGMVISRCLALTHCCLNPLVYALGGLKFQREFSTIFCRRCQTRRHYGSEEFSQGTDGSAVHGMDYSIMM
ncbi:C-X-C chemokine receptor type 3-2-like [Erythrolamprus reginae]|uniref:C-X-C chemokine receptor type 3-2-like n=1 Tax=Erythrolamprus reginae TaxID=121349 RepID=UPI00396C7F3D